MVKTFFMDEEDPRTDWPRNYATLSTPSNSASTYTIDEVLTRMSPFGKFQRRLLWLCGGGYFAICTELLVFVLIVPQLQSEWHVTPRDLAWVPFSATLSSFVGALVFGIVSDRVGRQKPFIWSIFASATFGVLVSVTPSLKMFLIVRSVMAFFLGGIGAIDFVLFLECMAQSCRGKYMVYITLYGALGVLSIAGLAWWILPRWGWRWLVVGAALPSFIVGMVRLFVTEESPRYTLAQGDLERTARILNHMADVNGSSFRVQSHELEKQPNIQRSVKKEMNDDVMAMMDWRRRWWHRILVSEYLQLFNATYATQTSLIMCIWVFVFTGYWGLTIYLPTYLSYFTQVSNIYLIFFLMVAAEIPGLICASQMIDTNFGRKGTLRVFLGLATTFTFLLALSNTKKMGFLSSNICLGLFAMGIYFALIPCIAILYTYTPELYPTPFRGYVMGLIHGITSLPGLICPFLSSYLLSLKKDGLEYIYGIIWATCFALAFICSLYLVKETAHHILDDSSKPSVELARNPSTQRPLQVM